jgi:hypothetical protein
MSETPRKLYVVQLRQFRIDTLERVLHFGEPEDVQEAQRRYPRLEWPERHAFANRAAAEACHAEREQAALASGNLAPLYAARGGLQALLELTDFDPPVFLDWLEDADIQRPPEERWQGSGDAWEAWLAGLTPHQVGRLYEGLHRLSFYELVEVDWIEGEESTWPDDPDHWGEEDIPF